MPQVMISYRNLSEQRKFAEHVEQELANAGITTWMDIKDIKAGYEWENEIISGIISSDYVLLCLSPDYFDSTECRVECYIARGYGKTLLPIIAPHNRPESVFDLIPKYEETRGIDHTNLIDFNRLSLLGLKQTYDEMIQRLLKAIFDPTPTDIDYDVFFSFKGSQAAFATQLADDLNQVGIKSFIHTRSIDVGANWRHVSWNAMLRAKVHVIVLSPDVIDSEYITLEVLVSRTNKNAILVPIIAEDFALEADTMRSIRQSFAQSKNLSKLNAIQWFIPDTGYPTFLNNLIAYINGKLGR